MKMTLKQLRVFDAVASNGSLASAASALNITLSTASAALKELQRALDRPPLFARNGRALQLTAEGEQLQAKVRNLLLSAAEIERPRRDGELRGTISIGAAEISDELLPRMAADFRKLHPQVRINIVAGGVQTIVGLLTRYAIDALIATALSRAPGMVLTEIYRERSGICASPDHPLAKLDKVTAADLEDAEWCMPARPTLSNYRTMEALRGHVTNFKVAMEINRDAGIREAVRANCGIACLPFSVIEADLASGRLVELKVSGLTTERPTYLVHMGDVERSAPARAFDEFIVAWLAKSRAEREVKPTG